MNKQMLHRFIDDCFDEWANREDFDPNEREIDTQETKPHADTPEPAVAVEVQEEVSQEAEEKSPKDPNKRVVRTKSTGDKVYVLDKEKKTKRWVTSPDVLKELGFDFGDVEEVEDLEFAEYRLSME